MSGRYRGGNDSYGGGPYGRDDRGGRGDYYNNNHRGGGYNDRRGGGLPPAHYRGGPPPYNNSRGGPPPPPRHQGYNNNNHRGGGHRGRPPPRRTKPGPITFSSYEEERRWVDERRRKRQERPTKFDLTQGGGGLDAMDASSGGEPQQTRHARRLYVGNLPPAVTEEQIHTAFRNAVRDTIDTTASSNEDDTTAGGGDTTIDVTSEDPILTVYINHERAFSFIEFKTVEICSACMALDGLEIVPGYPVKVKRPNDYNPATAPMTTKMPVLNVSKLGIISPTVLDGPNKIFIGGLHYHFTESQVLELLCAFGKVKAFHLVKNDPESTLSKGYCFVEYIDSTVTTVAVEGLNGMDVGDGKQLTARVAGNRDTTTTSSSVVSTEGAPPADRTIVAGYDIELLVDAALGHRNMPHGPTFIDPATGIPITRIVGGAPPVPPPPPPAAALTNQSLQSALAAVQQQQEESRILVLLNMVTDDDLSTAEDHAALVEEVQGECLKFGDLRSVTIPRDASSSSMIQPSAVRKVFLEYATVAMAKAALEELDGRQFGDAVVATEFLSEADFAAGRFH